MSDAYLIRNCAPTLAGIKTGSLFSLPRPFGDDLTVQLRKLNERLVPRGLRLIPLRVSQRSALLYLYRPSRLRRDLYADASEILLRRSGYCLDSCEKCLCSLIRRLQCSDEFPHEIGLFLGYPPEDVRGFIENRACNCKCAGCWKVYGDPHIAVQRFDLYKKCTRVYCELCKKGRTLEKLTVAG